MGRSVVGEFRKTESDIYEFTVDTEEIDAAAGKLGIDIKGDAVEAEFWKQMSQ